MNPHLFLGDLERKPDVLGRLADALDNGSVVWPVEPLPSSVVLIGMGSSLYGAQVAAHRMRAAGVIAIAESGSAETAFAGGPTGLTVGISAGGTSVETNRLFAASGSGRRVALTNATRSSIVSTATDVVDLRAEAELGGVACRTYTQTLVALLALEHALAGTCPDLAGIVRRTAAASQALLDRRTDWLPQAIDLLGGPSGAWLLAPLERQCSAMQGALMLREGPRRAAVGCETGDWSHVDVYLTTTLDYRALVFTGSRWDANAAAWMARRGSAVLAVGGDFPGAVQTIRYPDDDHPLVALLTETMVPELVAAMMWSSITS